MASLLLCTDEAILAEGLTRILSATEGLDLLRSRQAMDRAAQKLGFAVYRARKDGSDIPADEYARLSGDVANAEAEIQRIETLLTEAAEKRKAGGQTPPPASPPE